jgi:hypothetical protein
MADEPYHASWPLLLSSLSHSHFFITSPDASAPPEALSQELSQAWAEGLAFTVALLRRGVDPNAVPVLREVPGYRRAATFLDSEDQDYLHSLDHATTLQLYVPLSSRNDQHGLLGRRLLRGRDLALGREKAVRSQRPHPHALQAGLRIDGVVPAGRAAAGFGQ